MSKYYTAKRRLNLFDPKSNSPFNISRSKIDLFLECPKCFYLDRRLGIGRPPGYPFSLNSAVDFLLKKEFDIHRVQNSQHPLMMAYKIDAVPFEHELLNEWRNNFKGIRYYHAPTNLLISGAIDDIWINPKEELIVVDYKATAKQGEVNIDADWQIAYKRQVEMYQWLLRQNKFKVSEIAYFVYCNGNTDKEAFDAKLEFDIKILPYSGNTDWVEDVLASAKSCLFAKISPQPNENCDYCKYVEVVKEEYN